MKSHSAILAGTAMGLIMATAQLGAAPLPGNLPAGGAERAAAAPLMLAQETGAEEEERLRREREAEAEAPATEEPVTEEAPAAEAPPAEEAPAPEELPTSEEAPIPEEAPVQEEPAPVDEPAAEQAPPPEEPAPVEEPAPAEEPAAEQPPAEDAPPQEPEAPAEAEPEAPAETPEAPAETQDTPVEPTPEDPAAETPAEPAPVDEPAAEAPEEPAAQPAEPTAEDTPEVPAESAPEESPLAPDEAADPDEPAAGETAPVEPAPGEEAPAEEAPGEEAPAEGDPVPLPAPVEDDAAPVDGEPAPVEGAAPVEEVVPADQAIEEENLAPILDSQKDAEIAPAPAEGQPPVEGETPVEGQTPVEGAAPTPDQQVAPAQPAGPPPTSDADAQALSAPVEIVPLMREEGRRIERSASYRPERREGFDVLREIGDRVVVQFDNRTFVQSDERERLRYDASDVYYDELPRGRVRETIVRPNGVEVVTIRDRYGDVIRRSRIMPDGQEYVLFYADDRGFDDQGRRPWRDPARDLPPLRLTIPVSQYILEANRVEDPDLYYEFLHQPPVEQVRELYTVDEVRYSPRIRDIARRIDLDTLTFEFGAASIPESEIVRLEGVADAMHRMLEENPAESFLIEGHTDAVGSDEANLALSDRRAESVATALTNVFDIPPENLVTQGYGERYLKVATEEPERRNRRVAIRRITPLVTPMAQR